MRHKPIRCAFGRDLLRRLAKRQCFSLGKYIGQQYVVVPPQRSQRVPKRQEIAGDQPRSLVD